MKITVHMRVAALAALAMCAVMLTVASGAATLTVGGVTVGIPVLSVVKDLGTPDLVESTDDGHEWRWFDAKGIDVDLLTDDTLTVRQVLIARPEPVRGSQPTLVQPKDLPVLERSSTDAQAYLRSNGAIPVAEPEKSVSAWRYGGGIVVLELLQGRVRKILALDEASAARLSYIAGPRGPSYRSPRLIKQYPTDYPPGHPTGVVVVKVDIAASGAVRDVHVLVSSGAPGIDAAESLSMRKSTFLPAQCAGAPCDSIYLDREDYTG